tara:strand:+ start:319 stop:870 length:552 start_codon:yes stop_codon:yes gene_type:complete
MEKLSNKFIFMLNALIANNPKIKITILNNLQKQKTILYFLLNKFQKRSFLIRKIDFLRQILLLFKNKGATYNKGGHPKFDYKKKYIVKINSLKDVAKCIKWRNEIKLDNKLIHPYSITIIKLKIEYMIFKVFLNKGRNRQLAGKLNLLGYNFLELKIVSLEKISLGSFRESDLKLFNEFFMRI